tara:strand:- start:2402 stop:3043 length:642 start_codon:yes stop_codon:yes gene_type:complete
MATFVKNTQRLKPFRQHAETDVVNLFSLKDDDGDVVASYADLKADGGKINKGLLVSVKNGWKNTDDPVNKTGIGNPGASYTNTVSFRYGAAASVEPCASGSQPIGLTIWDVAEVDENGEKLIYHPRKAAEMQAVVSGQAVPVLTKGIVLYSGNLTSGGADSVSAGAKIYADMLRQGDLSASSTEGTGSATQTQVGVALGAVDADGFILLKIDL